MKEQATWESLREYLPAGWEGAARETSALQRSRNIRTAEELLTVNMVYLTEMGSYQGTSSLLKLTAGIELNKNAVRKRIQGSWAWLRWMGEALCREQGFAIPKPTWLEGRRALLTDGTDMALSGSDTSDYRLHYVFDLFGFRCESAELTSVKEGERLSRHRVQAGDIYVGDRAYGTITGMEHVRAGGGDFVLRLRSKAFTIYDVQGDRVDLLQVLSPLEGLQSTSLDVYYRTKEGKLRPVRIVAMRKEETAEREARQRIKRRTSRKQTNDANPDTLALASYIVLATSLTETPARVLELYRARWQIEQVFYRLKSLFRFGEVPGKNPDSVKAWFYGKLFLAALCEAVARAVPFSPGGIPARETALPTAGSEPLE